MITNYLSGLGIVAIGIFDSAAEYLALAETKLQKRFWSRVRGEGDDCWIWTGSASSSGYGQIGVGNHPHTAHRICFMLTKGQIPEGMCVLHRCDTPLCVNPTHLRTGTKAENYRDMMKRKRNNNGGHLRPVIQDRGIGI